MAKISFTPTEIPQAPKPVETSPSEPTPSPIYRQNVDPEKASQLNGLILAIKNFESPPEETNTDDFMKKFEKLLKVFKEKKYE
jgi:hypothetical protein